MTLSFEELLYEDNFVTRDKDGFEADRGIYEKELKVVIAEAIDTLNPKEKQVISLHYYEKLKFHEIAKIIGVTESRVCQIHSKSMLLLKRKLEDYVRN
jgi:RNA polymerase sigma factor for flagellar operon FliA